MFVSQLYTESIADKQIVTRSGFLDLLSRNKEVPEIVEGDSIMSDKGPDIKCDLQKIGLQLNIHAERAIGKARRFLIFNSRIPVSSLGTVKCECYV